MKSFNSIIKILNIDNDFLKKIKNLRQGNFSKVIVFIYIQGESKKEKLKRLYREDKGKGTRAIIKLTEKDSRKGIRG